MSARLPVAAAASLLAACSLTALDNLIGSSTQPDAGPPSEHPPVNDEAGNGASQDLAEAGTIPEAAADARPEAAAPLPPCAAEGGSPAPGRATACPAPPNVVIDGDLAEWNGKVPWVPLTHATAERPSNSEQWPDGGLNTLADDLTLSGRFALFWDASYVYLILQITDDVRGTHPPNITYYVDDAVEIYFSGANDHAATYGPTDHQYVIAADYTQTGQRGGEFHGGQGPVMLSFADHIATWQDGPRWQLEARFPLAAIGAPEPAQAGNVIGFDLLFDDNDTPDLYDANAPARYLIWTSRDCGYPAFCPSSFGEVVFSGP